MARLRNRTAWLLLALLGIGAALAALRFAWQLEVVFLTLLALATFAIAVVYVALGSRIAFAAGYAVAFGVLLVTFVPLGRDGWERPFYEAMFEQAYYDSLPTSEDMNAYEDLVWNQATVFGLELLIGVSLATGAIAAWLCPPPAEGASKRHTVRRLFVAVGVLGACFAVLRGQQSESKLKALSHEQLSEARRAVYKATNYGRMFRVAGVDVEDYTVSEAGHPDIAARGGLIDPWMAEQINDSDIHRLTLRGTGIDANALKVLSSVYTVTVRQRTTSLTRTSMAGLKEPTFQAMIWAHWQKPVAPQPLTAAEADEILGEPDVEESNPDLDEEM